MKQILSLLLLLTVITSCNEYNKLVKSEDYELKKTKGIEYYNTGDYIKAVTLLESAIPFYKLSMEGEKVYYYFCMGNYELKDYYLASYYFRRFISQYPSSKYTEECQFLSAMCSVHNSPEYALDQTETFNALDQLQVFADMYPDSEKMDTCNSIMDNLHAKLELKDFESAKLYHQTENYKAAVVAFDNLIVKYPTSKYKYEILNLNVLSNYELAINSIQSKKLERLNNTLKSYRKFVAEFPNSDEISKLNGLKDKTEAAIKEFNN